MEIHARISASVAAALALSWLGISPAAADPPVRPAAALGVAVGKLQAGDAAGAVAALQPITASEPDNAPAWRALGRAYRQLHEPAQAVSAYQHVLRLVPDSPGDAYALGASYAALHDAEHAFEWLQRAAATHRYDMTEIVDDASLASLRGDPRFNALLPRAADFEQPFVEPVKIIREWRGEAAGDQFGWIARNIGDVDGDGINDIVTSAPTHGAGNSNAGRIYVYSVGTGRLLWTADGQAGDQLGSGVEAAGDTNRDGIPDVVASGPAGAGIAHIYSGRDGRVLQTFKSPNADEAFGNHVSGAGDVNGDGYADVIVGSPGKEGETKVAGHAYIYSGKDGALLYSLSGERPGDGFGSTVAAHVEGRRVQVVVGAPGAGPRHHGRVYVYEGWPPRRKFSVDADETGSKLGYMFVSVPGDVDGDGVPDVYASDWSNAARGPSTGRVYMLSGRTGKPLYALTGETAGDGFGTSPSMAGDVDGDGRADLIIGAWQYAGAAVSGGKAYLYSGRDGRLLRTYTCRTPGDTFGFDAVGLGDVDGDGTVDLLVTSGWSAANGHHSGRVFVISSGVMRNSK
ncbi:MAG TPA: FG-GAP-like repeat-containing protein [Steroidobacteraceae bacterium]|nr:FG-GAP-like repeat-containing protein [Steroidobacteraceae bacterium]